MTQQNVPRIQSVQQNKNLGIIRKVFFLEEKSCLYESGKDLADCCNAADWQQIQVFPVKPVPGKHILKYE